jgi:hypothetical protein
MTGHGKNVISSYSLIAKIPLCYIILLKRSSEFKSQQEHFIAGPWFEELKNANNFEVKFTNE